MFGSRRPCTPTWTFTGKVLSCFVLHLCSSHLVALLFPAGMLLIIQTLWGKAKPHSVSLVLRGSLLKCGSEVLGWNSRHNADPHVASGQFYNEGYCSRCSPLLLTKFVGHLNRNLASASIDFRELWRLYNGVLLRRCIIP